jgi:hypothetical protein
MVKLMQPSINVDMNSNLRKPYSLLFAFLKVLGRNNSHCSVLWLLFRPLQPILWKQIVQVLGKQLSVSTFQST